MSTFNKLLITRSQELFFGESKDILIGREISKVTLNSLGKDEKIILASQLNVDEDDPALALISKIGLICELISITENGENNLMIHIKALERVDILKYEEKENKKGQKILIAEINIAPILIGQESKNKEKIKLIADLLKVLIEQKTPEFLSTKFNNIQKFKSIINKKTIDYAEIVKTAVKCLNFNHDEILNLISVISITEQLDLICSFISSEIQDPKKLHENIELKINNIMNKNIAKQQKEFYLREKLRVIKNELGDLNSREDDVKKIKELILTGKFPQHIADKILHEAQKFESSMNPNETGLIKSYIDVLLEIPWSEKTKDNIDIEKIAKILNKNHFGIEKVKERIIEYIALKTKNPDSRSPIICLVGPPGVGKTSLAKSIAEALNKVYVKISLGGIKDESEIRGHRKTYIGAMPGRIIKGMIKAGVTNPLFLLDELDKMANDMRGDPSSAMLEVLDPEQNSKFNDNYVEEDYDLSNVFFLATANYYGQIPYALIDRLEIIELSSYTIQEKIEIAKNHLVKAILENAKISKKELSFTTPAIEYIINHYTREAGVREINRQLTKIVMKWIVQNLKGKEQTNKIDIPAVQKYLGKIIYDVTLKDKNNIPGVVNGMAYTTVGGDLLPIEVSAFPGKGETHITGNLEKTMNESVSVAIGYVRSNAKSFKIKDEFFQNNDLHIHVPAGGIPKDGPSAGVAITTALISLILKKPIKTNISMTGEITLRGKVGIIGGVKEKVISAHRAGVREIFLPIDDERYLDEVPKSILKNIKIHLISNYPEIYSILFK